MQISKLAFGILASALLQLDPAQADELVRFDSAGTRPSAFLERKQESKASRSRMFR